jgi:hypothetical protein
MPIGAQGGEVPLKTEARNGSGQLQDASTVSLTLQDFSGGIVAGYPVVEPAIIHTGVGLYQYTWFVPVDQSIGSYTASWHSFINGLDAVGSETVEVVPPGSMSTGALDFLTKPDDYEAVRALLGVTGIDLHDETIELPSFGPQADLLVKQRVSNWASQLSDPLQNEVLHLAATYATAALIAESYVHGGTLGLIRPLSTGEGRDWAATTKLLWLRYQYWLNLADQNDVADESTAIYDILPLRISGPTALRIRRSRLLFGNRYETWLRYPPFGPLLPRP